MVITLRIMAKAPYKITNAPHEIKCYHLWLSIVRQSFTYIRRRKAPILTQVLTSLDEIKIQSPNRVKLHCRGVLVLKTSQGTMPTDPLGRS